MVTQPHSTATTDATPAQAALRQNHLDAGSRRCRNQTTAYQRASSTSTEPITTMRSKAQWAMVAWVAFGRSLSGTAVSPITLVSGLKPARMESSWGILMPPEIVPSGCRRPNRYSGMWVSVSQTISMAANFTGCFWNTCRAMESPRKNWIGVAMAATVKGTVKPSRW